MNIRKRSFNISFGSKKHIEKKQKKEEVSDNINDNDDVSLNLNHKDTNKKIERENNHIYFYSEVDRESIYELGILLKEAEEESIFTSYKMNMDEIPIYLHISSYGGLVRDAFNAIDFIQSCKVPVYTIIEGATASAGTLISVVGKKRYMRPNAFMLIHQLSSSFWGKMNEIEDEMKNLKDLMVKIKKVYKDHTDIPKKELNELLNHDLWFDSNKCLSYSLVDELWTKL